MKISPLPLQAVILFMSSSGTAKAEKLSLTVENFLKATEKYYNSKTINDILNKLSNKRSIVPTFILKGLKLTSTIIPFTHQKPQNTPSNSYSQEKKP